MIPNLYVPLVKFVIRVSYISHGDWEDLFPQWSHR